MKYRLNPSYLSAPALDELTNDFIISGYIHYKNLIKTEPDDSPLKGVLEAYLDGYEMALIHMGYRIEEFVVEKVLPEE